MRRPGGATPRDIQAGSEKGVLPPPSGYPRTVGKALVVGEDDIESETWSDPIRGDVGFRTVFGGDVTTAEFTVGVADLEAGGWLGQHRHDPAEIYYVVSGHGIVSIDGQEQEVRAGAVVYIPGNSEHGIRNTGSGRLHFFYAFAVGSFEEIEYQFTADRHQSVAGSSSEGKSTA
jgi:quercetin dioxygenase-like cupin family protein